MDLDQVAAIFKRNMSTLAREAASRQRSRAAHPAFDGPRPDVEVLPPGERQVA